MIEFIPGSKHLNATVCSAAFTKGFSKSEVELDVYTDDMKGSWKVMIANSEASSFDTVSFHKHIFQKPCI